MKAKSKMVVVVLALVMVLVGCSDDSSDEASEASTEADGVTSTAAEGTEAGETVIVETMNGEVTIPADPERMVVDWVTLDNLDAVGAGLDGVTGAFGLEWFASQPELSPYLTEAAEEAGITGVGEAFEPNFETLASLEPDVIVMAEDQAPDDPSILSTMEEIAPVVVYEVPGDRTSFEDWKAGLRGLAAVLGSPDDAESYIAGFEDRVADARADNSDALDESEITIAGFVDDSVWVSMPGRNLGTNVTEELGLARPAAQLEAEADEWGTFDVSLERLDILDADVIFLEQRQASNAFLEENVLFQELPAVQSGDVVYVANYWEFGGAGSASHVLEDVIAAVT